MSTIPQHGAIDNIPMTNRRRKVLGKLLLNIIKDEHFFPRRKNEFHHIFHQLESLEFNSNKEELFYTKLITNIAFDSKFPAILLEPKWLKYLYEYTRAKFKLSQCFRLKNGEIIHKEEYCYFKTKVWELVGMILADLFKKEHRRLMEIRKSKGLETDVHIAWNLFPFWLYRNYPSIYHAILPAELKYVLLEGIPMEQIVQYLPGFILEKLDAYLNNLDNQYLVKHLALGNNIRKVKKLPFKLSKKMAHQFHQINSNNSINTNISQYNIKFPLSIVTSKFNEDDTPFNESFIKAFVLGLGGSAILAKEFSGIYAEIDDYEFQKSIIEFFIKFPISNIDTLRRLLGYINHMRHENGHSYSMKGRTLTSLSRLANAYYEEQQRVEDLRRSSSNSFRKDISWKGADYSPYHIEENDNEYKIIQLCRSEDLYIESQRMNHCVRMYVGACLSKNCSIWSLRIKGISEWKSLVTIEVSKADNIVQAKARFNYKPERQWMTIIKEWAKKEGLNFGKKW